MRALPIALVFIAMFNWLWRVHVRRMFVRSSLSVGASASRVAAAGRRDGAWDGTAGVSHAGTRWGPHQPLVVLEAPIGSHYSSQVIEAAARTFPGLPLKAVGTTSDAWPHLGGAREYVSLSIRLKSLRME